MTEACAFCALIRDARSRSTIYEDEWVTAFLDAQPINPGHCLVVPNFHEDEVFRLEPDLYARVMNAARWVALSLKKTYAPKRIGLLVAGFDVAHAHVHVLPMHDYHDLASRALLDGTRSTASSEELDVQAARIRVHLGHDDRATPLTRGERPQ